MRFLTLPVRLVLAALSAAVTWYVTSLGLPYLKIPSPELFAFTVLFSVFIHELGHAIAYKRHGIKSLIVFLVILGGTMPLDVKKADQLSDTAQAEVSLAGMFGNIVVMVIAGAAYFLGIISGTWAARIINLNAALMLFNMIPVAVFDGARFMQLLFHNVSPQFGKILYEITSIPVLFGMMLILYMRGTVVLSLPLILIGLRYQRSHAENGGDQTKAMTGTQRLVWAITYVYLVLAALIAFILTPTWSQ